MTMQKTLGGDRLGSGKKMKVDLHNYERSTHNMGYIFRSTMSAGTLVPFLCEVGLPGDTFDINLDCIIKTHPTIGPLFGSFKVQLDIFHAPIRLYQGMLHNNKLGIGRKMSDVKLPLIRLSALPMDDGLNVDDEFVYDYNTSQINPSNILAYLGIRGVGATTTTTGTKTRDFNAVPLLAYWDIYKNYYANKQEEIGAVIHSTNSTVIESITAVTIDGEPLDQYPDIQPTLRKAIAGSELQLSFSPPGSPTKLEWVMLKTDKGVFNAADIFDHVVTTIDLVAGVYNNKYGTLTIDNWRYAQPNEVPIAPVKVVTFNLADIDTMREALLLSAGSTSAKIINVDAASASLKPYDYIDDISAMLSSQEGLGIKTYNSDIFNNWLKTEWIDGAGGINEITAIDTSSGSFTIDTLNLSKKVYNMLNRIAVSGGTYDDWVDAVYTHDRFTRIESPVYHGGLIKELVFQEVVSNASTEGNTATQPLGTLAGKGIMSGKHKGGNIIVKIDEPSYIIGIISLTPRIDYSQGNRWDVNLKTMDDFHKPALDEIGFQELITEKMAWWSTNYDPTSLTWVQRSAGKQPAWLDYMTNYNKTFGNFAIENNEMFMTLNRKFELDQFGPNDKRIKDLTTYIDPAKFNNIFADTSLDAQNFWTQIGVDMTVRRKMSAKIMPNL